MWIRIELIALTLLLAAAACTTSGRNEEELGTSGEALIESARGSLLLGRHRHTSTILSTGEVLIAGGRAGPGQGPIQSQVELFDPARGTSRALPSLLGPRTDHGALLLRDGRVLVAGGFDGSLLRRTELYDPKTNTWTQAGQLNVGRAFPALVLLPDGRALLVGGWNAVGLYYSAAEIFDPATGTWSSVSPMAVARALPNAVVLNNGRVLIIGGSNGSGALSSCEIFDPATATFTTTSPMNVPRYQATATLLPDGRVMVAGGETAGGQWPTSSAEVYSAEAQWTLLPPMSGPRALHTATLTPDGQVFVAGGYGTGGMFVGSLTSTELFDPSSDKWTPHQSMVHARQMHSAAMLPSGRVALFGGMGLNGQQVSGIELFDGSSPVVASGPSLALARRGAAPATLPDGRVVLVGGIDGQGPSVETELLASSTWSPLGNLLTSRHGHTATLLDSIEILAAGGRDSSGELASAEVLELTTGTWRPVGALVNARWGHTATALPNGRVAIVGGTFGTSSVEHYSRWTESFSIQGSLITARRHHTTTLLADGRLFVAGGEGVMGPIASVELYNPYTGIAVEGPPLKYARARHAATLLPNGGVLITGGGAEPELFVPATNAWSPTAGTSTPRIDHSAVLLQNGKVLVAGGRHPSSGTPIAATDLYDPARNVWTAGPAMATARAEAAAMLLSDGRVLLAGGEDGAGAVFASSEVFDEGRNTPVSWRPSVSSIGVASSGSAVPVSGSRFRGLGEGSSGIHQTTPSNHPVFTFRRIDTGGELIIPAMGWDSTLATLEVPPTVGAGWYQVRVSANGMTSAGEPLFILKRNGSDCVLNPECSSGHCVEGLCCDRSCDRGVCETCAAANGAANDGTCTLLGFSNVCRQSSGVCDAVEYCDGVNPACPADALSTDGTQCAGGRCNAGVCVQVAEPDAGAWSATDAGVEEDGGASDDAPGVQVGCGCGSAGPPLVWLTAVLLTWIRRSSASRRQSAPSGRPKVAWNCGLPPKHRLDIAQESPRIGARGQRIASARKAVSSGGSLTASGTIRRWNRSKRGTERWSGSRWPSTPVGC